MFQVKLQSNNEDVSRTYYVENGKPGELDRAQMRGMFSSEEKRRAIFSKLASIRFAFINQKTLKLSLAGHLHGLEVEYNGKRIDLVPNREILIAADSLGLLRLADEHFALSTRPL